LSIAHCSFGIEAVILSSFVILDALRAQAASSSSNLVQTGCKPDVNPMVIGFTSGLHPVSIGLGEGDEQLALALKAPHSLA